MADPAPAEPVTPAAPQAAPALTEPTSPAPPAGTPAAAAPPDPFANMSTEHRAYITTKGWVDPNALVQSYKQLEAMRGVPEEELLRIPKADDDEGWQKFQKRIGRPDTFEEYDLGDYKVPEGEIDLRPLAHEAGLTQKQVRHLHTKMRTVSQEFETRQAEARQIQADNDVESLQHEWGSAYNERIEAGRQAAQQLELDPETLNKMERALGTKHLLTLMSRLGRGIGEAGLPPDGITRPSGVSGLKYTRAEAVQAYEQWNQDPANRERMSNLDPKIRMAAAEERARISRAIDGEG